MTGLPSVINLSFNMHEEPTVYTPNDALKAFRGGYLDCLANDKFLIWNSALKVSQNP